jgi:hypothetical protein
MKTDYDRWEKTATQAPSWDERNRFIGAMIPEGASVIDVGAGNMTIRNFIPSSCVYQPVDCVKGCSDTLIADFNNGIIPELGRQYDYAICSGVLEYMQDPGRFLAVVSGWADTILLSYAVTNYKPDAAQRRSDGWFNDLSLADLAVLFAKLDLVPNPVGRWGPHVIFRLSHPRAPEAA